MLEQMTGSGGRGRSHVCCRRPLRSVAYVRFQVRREKAALHQWVQIPPGEMLQPEATGAVMEAMKWLKPPVQRVTKYGDVASVQAVTRVNTEQPSKRTMRRPTRSLNRGRLI